MKLRSIGVVAAIAIALGVPLAACAPPTTNYEEINDKALAADLGGDVTTAYRLRKPLAERGNARAQFAIGEMYEHGRGVPQDYAKAGGWYHKAAQQGHATAQFYLGGMYALGRGVPQDYVQAHKWFNLVAASGDADGVKGRELVAERMSPAQIAEAQRLASSWRAKPSPAGR